MLLLTFFFLAFLLLFFFLVSYIYVYYRQSKCFWNQIAFSHIFSLWEFQWKSNNIKGFLHEIMQNAKLWMKNHSYFNILVSFNFSVKKWIIEFFIYVKKYIYACTISTFFLKEKKRDCNVFITLLHIWVLFQWTSKYCKKLNCFNKILLNYNNILFFSCINCKHFPMSQDKRLVEKIAVLFLLKLIT